MNKQKGFAHAFLIIGLVVALIGALGFVFWQNFIYKEPVATKVETVPVKTESKTETPQTVDSDPTERLQKLYDDYLADTSSYRGDSGLAAFKASGYIAQDYTITKTNGEPLVCGQEAYPDRIKVSLVSKDDSKATLSGTKIYNDGSNASNSIIAEMTLNSNSEWQLQKTTCIDN